MNIKGIHKTSLIDYPGKISSVFFTGGCNLRCGYCHNPELVCNYCTLESVSNEDALSFMKKRKLNIDGIAISGGEPTLAKNLISFISIVKDELSLAVKLDTNGLNPIVITKLLNMQLLDYIAIDVKTSPEKYDLLTNTHIDFSLIKETFNIVNDAGIDYEIRTTCIPYYVTLDDFVSIGHELGRVKQYYLQQFVNSITLDSDFTHYTPYSVIELQIFKDYVSTFADFCSIRGI